MSSAKELLCKPKEQLDAGFKIAGYEAKDGVHHFTVPALEYSAYTISIPDDQEVKAFVASEEFSQAKLAPIKVGVALLDLVGFSTHPDEVQLHLLVRYQCFARDLARRHQVDKMISIGDGTIFVFEEPAIASMPEFLLELDHELAGYALDWKHDGVPEIDRRVGVHVGNAYCFRDINHEYNYVGTGINLAQRVSACVPSRTDSALSLRLQSPIYVSAEAKREFEWLVLPPGVGFADAGEKEAKHGVRIHAYAMFREPPD